MTPELRAMLAPHKHLSHVQELKRKKRRKTAVHEAGHAIVALMLRMHVDKVSLYSRGSIRGIAYIWMVKSPTRREARLQILVLLAGREAERQASIKADGGDGKDKRDIAELVSLHGFSDFAMESMRRLTERLVRQHWESIRRVADTLERRATLDKMEFAAVIAGVA